MTTARSQGQKKFSDLTGILWDVLSDGIGRQKKPLVVALLFALLTIAGALAAPYILKQIVDDVLPQKNTMQLLLYAGLLIGTYSLSFVFWAAQIRYSVRASENIFYALRGKLVARILNKPLGFFSRFVSGDLLTRMANDLEFISEFFYQNLFRSVAYCLFSLVIIVFLMVWNWKLGLIALSTLPLFLFYVSKTHEPIAARARVTKQDLSSQTEVLLDILQGIRELRFFQQEAQGVRRFDKSSRKYTDSMIGSNTFTDWMRIGIDFLGMMITLVPFVVGGLFITAGDPQITIGLLIAYFQLLTILTGQVQFVFAGVTRLAQLYPGLQRLKEIIDYPEDKKIEVKGIQDTPDSTEIEFRGVCFTYPSGKEVLSGFDLKVQPGEKLAIMGPSGSGKSTIANLLIKFLAPTRGEILFGGKNIQEYSYPLYLSFFSYVSQETHLFRESMADNIAMGWYNVPQDRIEQVASVVRMHDYITSLPQKYATVFGEKGVGLSGGQRQRLALARALIRDPEILVLDEFTSALDKDVEQEILDDLLRIFNKQTIICITHSRSVASRFERVVNLSLDQRTA